VLLNPEVLHWQAQHVGWSSATSQLGKLATQEFAHADLRLNSAREQGQDRDEDRKDAIAALWRAVERRQQLFDQVYAIKVPLRLGNRKHVHLGHLQELGLIRGSVLDDIRRLRNAIQHRSEMAPRRSQCLLYQDAVWYFLRSTETYARRVPTGYEFIEDYEHYGKQKFAEERIEVTIGPPRWAAAEVFCENLSPDHYSMTNQESWIPVETDNNFVNAGPDGSAFVMGFITDPAWIVELSKVYFSCV
jgi:hypothetical protein